ncbi:MAG: phosphoglycerate mutase family protein [Solirubrobacterales bacterium]
MPTILLVRHGQASFGAEDYDALSPTGAEQARVLGAALRRRGVRIDRLASGTMQRQRETAELVAPGAALATDPRWNEYDANDLLAHHSDSGLRLDGPAAGRPALTNREFQAAIEPALRDWVAAAEGSPGAQTWPEFAGGARAALAELAAGLERGQTGVVVSSGGVVAAVCAALLEAPDAAFAALNRTMVNAGVTKVAIGATGAFLVSSNDHSHLEEADPALVTYR